MSKVIALVNSKEIVSLEMPELLFEAFSLAANHGMIKWNVKSLKDGLRGLEANMITVDEMGVTENE